jgi:hypothetical protein
MVLTRDFKETVAARVQADPAFAQALLDEAVTLFFNGESDTAKLILRDLVNATVGFERWQKTYTNWPRVCIGCFPSPVIRR